MNDSTRSTRSSQIEHTRVTEDMRNRIRTGFWTSGAMIPGRRFLAQEYGVSPATLERALVPLLAAGELVADHRRGTFVGRVLGLDPLPVVKPSTGRNGATAGSIGIISSLYDVDNARGGENDYWVRQLTDSVERYMAAHGRQTVFQNRVPEYGQRPIPLVASLQRALQSGLTGVILVGIDVPPHVVDEAIGAAGVQDTPLVSILHGELARPLPHVVYDDRRAGYFAAEQLITVGFRQISVIAPFHAPWSEDRIQGVRNAMDCSGISGTSLQVFRGPQRPYSYEDEPRQTIHATLEGAFASGWTPHGGVVCINDLTATLLLRAVAAGLCPVPEDYGLVGFDDYSLARLNSLTSIKAPMEAMGREAAKLLLHCLDDNSSISVVKMQPQLIVRQTIRTPTNWPSAHEASESTRNGDLHQ